MSMLDKLKGLIKGHEDVARQGVERSPMLRVASLVRLAIHGARHRSLIRPDRQDTP
ncbi:hypothetical protein [Streptomyces sp. NRRL F-2747]|uniref:hypothetical protein n=1 Tax=Streptomyces sp. NRRL F-2747 TaxID=1463843 RepID=UPI000B1DC4FD|nr:hypothetical protein [Streptomyces sp. NRRL F-2747]